MNLPKHWSQETRKLFWNAFGWNVFAIVSGLIFVGLSIVWPALIILFIIGVILVILGSVSLACIFPLDR